MQITVIMITKNDKFYVNLSQNCTQTDTYWSLLVLESQTYLHVGFLHRTKPKVWFLGTWDRCYVHCKSGPFSHLNFFFDKIVQFSTVKMRLCRAHAVFTLDIMASQCCTMARASMCKEDPGHLDLCEVASLLQSRSFLFTFSIIITLFD